MISWTRALSLPVAAAAVVVLAACGSGAAPAAPAPSTGTSGMPGMSPEEHAQMDQGGQAQGGHGGHGSSNGALELWAVQTAPLGVVVTDGAGLPIYRSDQDTSAPSASACTGDCANTWEPLVLTPGQPPTLLGVKETAVSAVARSDGSRQLTLAGWPLYRHRGDRAGLENAAANGADGVWFVIRPNGEKAAPPAPAAPAAPAGPGG